MLSLFGILCRAWRCALCGQASRKPSAETGGQGDAETTASDDLTAIRGIGIASQNRLYAAGIKSYAELARASAEDLRKILGKFARGARVEDWIARARELAAEP